MDHGGHPSDAGGRALTRLTVALALLFSYALTSRPILENGLALAAAVPIALAADTVSSP